MNNFWKSNIAAIIGLVITIGGLLIYTGEIKNEIAAHKIELAEFKVETKTKIKELEDRERINTEKVNEKLDTLNRQVAVVVSWIEEQKRNSRNP